MKPIDPITLTRISHVICWGELSYGVITVKGVTNSTGWTKKIWSRHFIEYKESRLHKADKGIFIHAGQLELELGRRRTPIPGAEIFEVIRQCDARVGENRILVPSGKKAFPQFRVFAACYESTYQILGFAENDYKIFFRRYKNMPYVEVPYQITAQVLQNT